MDKDKEHNQQPRTRKVETDCPSRSPLELFETKIFYQLEEIHKDLKRILKTTYGEEDGSDGLLFRVAKLEFQLSELTKDVQTLVIKMQDMQDRNESWKWQIGKALFFLASGAGTATGIIQFL